MSITNNILEVNNLLFKWRKTNNFKLKINKLAIKKKKRVILLGASGSGKSTLLNLISGILEPNKGIIKINDTCITALSSKQKDLFRTENLGVIFQQFNIIEYLSPITNILLPCYFSLFKNKKISFYRERAADLGKKLGIEKDVLFQKKAKNLSVGQQQRIAIIRALINFPKIILADEPTSALDYKNKEKFLNLLFDMCEQENISIFMVSHDNLITKYFDDVLLLEKINEAS
ncbi:MAG: putative ABC transporter ATP-binding protein [Alphaproteobacteria bacterium MarineAlpha9_Bin4]|nr:methionine ABC transporter ATP-binding protein [Pelagibacterales bacterium]PPR25252.1 MAG: putative ABC transporter ATP-binding protein [Alphaproteobacteria bacterium MarineAlpha9_Bin4]|tara:strand:+ start:379 stop:1071 length:693 start_codon:yes stop_codon:yes gene_type:complete